MIRILKTIISHESSIKFLFANILRITWLCRLFTIQLKNFKLKFFPTSMSVELFVDNNFRKEDFEIYNKVLKQWDIFIDIWANIWFITLEASSLIWEKWHVYSFEPTPTIYWYLKENIKINNGNNVTSYNYWLWDKEWEIWFSSTHADDMNKISENWDINVKVVKLDNINEINNKRIKLIKIDVEWYEKQVLLWSLNVLDNTDIVYFESDEKLLNLYWSTTQDVFNLLISKWFLIYDFINGALIKLDSSHISIKPYNLLAIKDIEKFNNHN